MEELNASCPMLGCLGHLWIDADGPMNLRAIRCDACYLGWDYDPMRRYLSGDHPAVCPECGTSHSLSVRYPTSQPTGIEDARYNCNECKRFRDLTRHQMIRMASKTVRIPLGFPPKEILSTKPKGKSRAAKELGL